MLTNAQTDEALHKAAAGDMDALHTVYEAHRQAVFLLSFSLARNKQLAEDVMQDTFLVACEKAASFQPLGKGKAWLLGIARNLTLQQLEKKQKDSVCDALDGQQADTRPRFEDIVEQNMQIKQLLSVLNEKEQTLVVLHILADVKLKDIAELLHMPLGTVYWSYNNALHKLRRRLQAGRDEAPLGKR